jgi:hypothetical protein
MVEPIWTPEFFWRLFESTGSIWAYLLYRRLSLGGWNSVELN